MNSGLQLRSENASTHDTIEHPRCLASSRLTAVVAAIPVLQNVNLLGFRRISADL